MRRCKDYTPRYADVADDLNRFSALAVLVAGARGRADESWRAGKKG